MLLIPLKVLDPHGARESNPRSHPALAAPRFLPTANERPPMRHFACISRRLSFPLALFVLSCSSTLTSLTSGPRPALAQPEAQGQWAPPSDWGGTAVHMALLRGDWGPHPKVHSQLIWWGFIPPPYPHTPQPGDNLGLWAWNPDSDYCDSRLWPNLKTLAIPVPPRNIFCAGHCGLPSGDLMIIGGHENGITGLVEATVFRREN